MNHHPGIRWTVILSCSGLLLFALLAAGQALAQERAPAAPLSVNVPVGTSFTYQELLVDAGPEPAHTGRARSPSRATPAVALG